MNKRIRYSMDADGCYVSNKIIETAHGEVFVKFNPDNRVVQLITPAGALVSSFVGTTSHQIKINIKEKLIEMGAEFEPEKRHREKDESTKKCSI